MYSQCFLNPVHHGVQNIYVNKPTIYTEQSIIVKIMIFEEKSILLARAGEISEHQLNYSEGVRIRHFSGVGIKLEWGGRYSRLRKKVKLQYYTVL